MRWNDEKRRGPSIALDAALAGALAMAIGGCQGPAFRAANLPPEFRAAARSRDGAINLAGIAAPSAAESRLDAGDLLEVTIASGRDDETIAPILTRVSDSGAADIPLVGPVQVGGLEPFEASQAVANAAIERGIYRRPHVSLEIKTKAVNRITVMGAVLTPGVYELPRSSSDLVKALAMAGGLTEEAGTVVEIVRSPATGQPMLGSASPGVVDAGANKFQLTSYQFGGSLALPPTVRVDMATAAPAMGDFRLGDRDMVMVLPREKEMIFVTGLVEKPGQFELPRDQEVRLLDAIAMSGGLSSVAADKVLVIRRAAGRPGPAPIQASVRIAKRDGRENLVLAAGDVVSVEQTPATVVVDALMQLFRITMGVNGRTTVF
jgi:polysaccharide export outer membrane protein